MKLYVVAGEPSADRICARLIRSLRQQLVYLRCGSEVKGLRVRGVAGCETQRTGGLEESLFPANDLAVMGVTDAVSAFPRIAYRGYQIVKDVHRWRPDVAVFIDGKGFSRHVAPRLPRDTIKIQYVAPSIWAWKGGERDARKFGNIFDHLLLLFPFEESSWRSAGVGNTTVVGSESVEEYLLSLGIGNSHSTGTTTAAYETMDSTHASLHLSQLSSRDKIDSEPGFRNNRQICVMLGSRVSEIRWHGPVVGTALDGLSRDMRIVVPIASSSNSVIEREVLAQVKKWSHPNVVLIQDRHEILTAMKTSYAGVTASGTAVLECALCGLPTVVVYKSNLVTELLAKSRALVKYVSIPNILSNQAVLPEVLFSSCTADSIGKALGALINDTQYRLEVVTGLRSSMQLLLSAHIGNSKEILLPSEIAARMIINLLNQEPKCLG